MVSSHSQASSFLNQCKLSTFVKNPAKTSATRHKSRIITLIVNILKKRLPHDNTSQLRIPAAVSTVTGTTISRMAAEMISNRYRLSKSNEQTFVKDEERLHELIPHLLIDFKLGILEEDMKQTIQQLNQPEALKNPERAMEIMKHYKKLTDTMKAMAKRAGDRVILKA